MKKLKIAVITGLAAITALSSCKDLDLYPANAIETGQSFQTYKDAVTWNNGLYAHLRVRQYGAYMTAADIQADYLNASLDYGNRQGDYHRWTTLLADDQGALRTNWSGIYNSLANVNRAIEGFANINMNGTTTAEKANFELFKGDNYLTRAYFYAYLINRYAKPYDPATAASDLGVPLLLKFELNAAPARATVKAVYDQILADIAQGKALIAAASNTRDNKTRWTPDAALALEARVRFNMKDWAGAYTAANTLITSGRYPLHNTVAGLRTYWHNDGTQETIMQPFVSTSELPPTNAIYLGFLPASGRFQPDFIPTQQIIDLYPASDIRKPVYFEAKNLTVQGQNVNGVTLVNKYPGNPALFTAATTNYAHAPKTFRIGEMYTIAAEAAMMIPNEANARTALNALRVARGLTATVSTGATLMQEIRDERTRELAFEGFRLDDLERWGLGFNGRPEQNSNIIFVGPSFNQLVIPANHPKFVWAIPSNDVSINPNLVQNPGW